jgi:hypothetical protein
MVKSMRRNEFCALCILLVAAPAGAQQIPGRDLLEFPLGSLAEGAALALMSGDGFRNPAAILLPEGVRARLSASSLTTGADQGVEAQLLGVAYALPRRTSIGLSLARAAVDGIVRTDTDPQSVGGSVPYNTIVVSALVAHRPLPHVRVGGTLRYQHGEIDTERRGGVGLDGGLIVDSLTRLDARIGVSSFLWQPASGVDQRPALNAAVDLRLIGVDSVSTLRAGYGFTTTSGMAREHFVSAAGRIGVLEGRVGVARTSVASNTTTRPRFAVGLRHARYLVAVAREDSRIGLSPVYHFTLSATLTRPR